MPKNVQVCLKLCTQIILIYIKALIQVVSFLAVKFLIQRVLEQLMGRGLAMDEEQEDDKALHLNTQCSISDLCQWYNSVKVR